MQNLSTFSWQKTIDSIKNKLCGNRLWERFSDPGFLSYQAEASAGQPKKLRTLIVDDDVTSCYIMEIILENAGFVCQKAFSVQEAVSIINSKFCPDLIVSDFHIGSDSAVDVISIFRSLPHLKNRSAILVSTDKRANELVHDAAFDLFLDKKDLLRCLALEAKRLVQGI